MEDLVDTCIPGDIVVVCGTIKAMSLESEGRSKSQKNKTLFMLYMCANSVSNFKETTDQVPISPADPT